MVRARAELPSVVVTEPGGHQTLVLPPHTSMATPGSRAAGSSHTSGRSTMSLATAGSVLHPSYLDLHQNGPRPAFSGGCRGALLLVLSSATACALFGPPSTTLILNYQTIVTSASEWKGPFYSSSFLHPCNKKNFIYSEPTHYLNKPPPKS